MKQFIFLLAIILYASVSSSQTAAFWDFEVRIDPKLKADPEFVPVKGGKEKVGVLLSPLGTTDQFVEGEVVFKPKDQSHLADFLHQYNGSVLDDGKIPVPPDDLKDYVREIPEQSGYYRIKIDPDKITTRRMAGNAEILGISGKFVCSSEEMLKLFALVLKEHALGNIYVNLNMVFQPQCIMTATQEEPFDSSAPNSNLYNEGYESALNWACFNEPGIDVIYAWDIVEKFNISETSVPLCVIDVGFWLNADFPLAERVCYDFVEDDTDVNADEEGYHGTGSLSLSCARYNNRFGAAGIGAPVALPMPFRFDLTMNQCAEAIRTAIAWGASVINISCGGLCNWWCLTFLTHNLNELDDAINEAFDNNVIVITGAGNDEVNIGAQSEFFFPAENGESGKRAIVVGAIDLHTKNAASSADGYNWGSNYGDPVDIWAPGGPQIDIYATPNPDYSHLAMFSGTSAAAAYTSGVVAMMRALLPGITTPEVRNILQTTASESTDPLVVAGYLHADSAIISLLDRDACQIPNPDEWEPNTFSEPATVEPNQGSICANLSLNDPEDGFYFFVDDFRMVSASQGLLYGIGSFSGRLRGANLQNADMPFNGNLAPGAYFVDIPFVSPLNFCFYQLDITSSDPLDIAPDRFEVNDELSSCAFLDFPEDRINDTWTQADINFHVYGDPDFFELELPELPDGPFDAFTDRLTIWIEPMDNGFNSSFHIYIYDGDGNSQLAVGSAVEIDNFRADYPDGRIRFSVHDYMDQRNYYRMIIGYDQYRRGNTPPPDDMAFFKIPEWIQAERDLPFLYPLPELFKDVPFDFPFPSNYKIVKEILAGKPVDEFPVEKMIIIWEDEKRLFGVNFEYYGDENLLDFLLIDECGKRICETNIISSKPLVENGSNRVVKRLEAGYLKPGIYGIEIYGKHFPGLYTVIFDPPKDGTGKRVVRANEEPGEDHKNTKIPGDLTLFQNYPNPFNPETTIRYDISGEKNVNLDIYDVQGRFIKELVNQRQHTGSYSVQWYGRDEQSFPVPSGIYLCRIRAGESDRTIKLLLVR
ncbi:S8 family serine peptidase [candidate division KSB1 bacterium]|nr:S8 family serine peptidase [candidate division KSB1 bacterium]